MGICKQTIGVGRKANAWTLQRKYSLSESWMTAVPFQLTKCPDSDRFLDNNMLRATVANFTTSQELKT
jgi:hypothetical protein